MAALYEGVTNRINRNLPPQIREERMATADSENVKIDSLFRQEYELLALAVSSVKWKEIDKERNGPYFISEAIFRYASHFLFLKFILNQETNLSSNFLPFELSI
ncbi:MAG: hypothetical protein M3P08_01570 [Thermoproteota archaeon]|nr:hypothetical protein [Thermoproteota archaeon]